MFYYNKPSVPKGTHFGTGSLSVSKFIAFRNKQKASLGIAGLKSA